MNKKLKKTINKQLQGDKQNAKRKKQKHEENKKGKYSRRHKGNGWAYMKCNRNETQKQTRKNNVKN